MGCRTNACLSIPGYQLCDNSVGVLFNDCTRLMMYADEDSLQYMDNNGASSFVSVRSYPDALHEKILLLRSIRSYMNTYLLDTGANVAPHQDRDVLVRLPWRLPYLVRWLNTRRAIAMHLSTGAVQVNFFRDHTKLIFCPLTATVTHMDDRRGLRTYRLPLLEECGCSESLVRRIRYAKRLVSKML